MASVLYLGCPPAERLETEKALAAAGIVVVWADHVQYAVTELARHEMPLLVDLSRGAGALQGAREIRSHRASTLMFAVVDPRRPDLTTEAVLAGMADVFARPLAGRRVAAAIDRELGLLAGERTVENGGQDLYNHSPGMREVIALIARASTVRSGVTIRGESGSGRQLVARSIHELQREGTPFVAVDCAAFEADQLDTSLFGTRAPEHSKGLERLSRDSLVHAANHGTLYLKNLDEARTRVQMRLARLLRDREAILVETEQNVVINVRPMAGVEPGIEKLVEEGRVRDDLFRRLSAVRIDMPPLRSRREDIPALANFFVRRICAGLRIPPKTLSRPVLSLLSALPWRGNADELKTLLESVVTGLAGGRNIGLEDVLNYVRLDGGSVVVNSGTLRQARLRFEREYIAAVLEQHNGRISEAAKALGIQRTNLYRKMRTLRVGRDRRRRG